MKAPYLLVIELEAVTDQPELLDALLAALLSQQLASLNDAGHLAPFDTLRILQRPAYPLSEDNLRVRRLEEEMLQRTQRIVEERLPYRATEPTQLPLVIEGAA